MSSEDIPPWVRGPFELIRHADGHLQRGGDTDRLIALIGLDNAIEVCIDVFLNLHPRLRGGFEIPRDDRDRALRNFHSKLEFLDGYVQSQAGPVNLPIERIIWYHSLRIELYHSGNGMIPEAHVIQGAKVAAIDVFKSLFGIDLAAKLPGGSVPQAPSQLIQGESLTGQMQLLQSFVAFERELKGILESDDAYKRIDVSRRPETAPQLWQAYVRNHDAPARWLGTVERSIRLRNELVHGAETNWSEDALREVAADLDTVTKSLPRLPAPTRVRERRPNRLQEISQFLEEVVREREDVVLAHSGTSDLRFLPSEWLEAPMLQQGTGWGRSKLLLAFEFNSRKHALFLRLWLGPGPAASRERLYRVACARQPPFNVAGGGLSPKWKSLYSDKFPDPPSDDEGLEPYRAMVRTRWQEFTRYRLPSLREALIEEEWLWRPPGN
jgi:hypothetical protein